VIKERLLTGGTLAIKAVTLVLVGLLFAQGSFAQSYSKGRHVEPAFEGWRPNPDGTFNLMFGYMNENWEESPDMPVGDNNFFLPWGCRPRSAYSFSATSKPLHIRSNCPF
jgi:hypothetical protein